MAVRDSLNAEHRNPNAIISTVFLFRLVFRSDARVGALVRLLPWVALPQKMSDQGRQRRRNKAHLANKKRTCGNERCPLVWSACADLSADPTGKNSLCIFRVGCIAHLIMYLCQLSRLSFIYLSLSLIYSVILVFAIIYNI